MPLVNYQTFQEKEQFFDRHTIDTIDEFNKWRDNYKDNPNKWYRTLSESKYRVYTSVQRSWITNDVTCQRIRNNFTINNFIDYVFKLLDLVKNDNAIHRYFDAQGIELNDALLFALLQHYGYPSPFLDFTYDLDTTLFFSIPNGGNLPLPPFTPNDTIDDYFSVYVIDGCIDWFQCSMQRIETNGAENMERLLADFNGEVDATEVQNQMRTLDYHTFSELPFVMVDGTLMGVQRIQIPLLGFTANYHIENPRVNAQMGLFLCNPSENNVMEQVVYNTTNQILIECFDIHKSLRPYIIDEILTPNNITKETMYMEHDSDTQRIKALLNAAMGML